MSSNNTITVFFEDGTSRYESVDKPDKCPLCHNKIDPIYCQAYYSYPDDITAAQAGNMEVIWRCPSRDCSNLFISYYSEYKFLKSEPSFPQALKQDPEINSISPRFYEIYSQVMSAKAHQLNELAGMGLRKALEILVKDFCISKDSSNRNGIEEKLTLHQCIEKYFDGHVKTCATKCKLLGNDETHYKRKYEDKDIADLEKLMTATLYWIGVEIITNSYDDI